MSVSIAGAKAFTVFNYDNGTNRCGTFTSLRTNLTYNLKHKSQK